MATKAVTRPQPSNPERVAWTVLLTAFFTLVTLSATLVFGGGYWLRNAASNQNVAPVYSGAVQVTRPGGTAPEVNPASIPVESTIRTDPNVGATLTFAAPNGGSEVARIQIFGGSTVTIVAANSPRFSTGVQPHHLVLRVSGGRVRALVGVAADRPVVIEIESDAGAVAVLEVPGTNAEVEVTAVESMITVREGQASVRSNDSAVVVAKDQRSQVLAGAPPSEPVPAERNLIRNGDFGDDFDGEWALDILAPQDPNESPGTVDPVINGGRRIVRFQRSGINFGQVGIVQNVERDVRGYTTLRLQMDVMIADHDVKNCGQVGTECPLMVKINYVDVYDKPREWLQGFFYNYDPGFLGTFCASCPIQWQHEPWPKGQWQPYASPNLVEVFEELGTPAAFIQSITLYASGHTFTSFVSDVQLLAE